MGTVRRLKTRDMELQVRSIQKNTRSIRVNPEFLVQYPEYPDISGSSGSKFRKFRLPQTPGNETEFEQFRIDLRRINSGH